MEALLTLTAGLPEMTLDPGDVLIREGDATGHLYVLVEGRLMVRKGDEDFVAIDAPGGCVGEMAVLLGRRHTATVIAVEPCRLRVIRDAEAALDENPPVLHAVATLLARRLNLVNQYLGDLQDQYREVDGGLGMVGDVLRTLASHTGDEVDPGSEREPDPLY
jgi:CRP/FNR family cyclic AMP-dependent transcriptional regulator